jgi:hypothetical protein
MPSLGLGRGGEAVGGRPVSETPWAEASGESVVLQDPFVCGLGRSRDTGRSTHVSCWRPSKGRFGPWVFLYQFFPLKGRSGAGFVVGFHPNLGTPNCGTR